ncbi:MAG: phospho-sugar mutase [Cyclobacteriaceae bacterium]|nr:phospho-sugar mutase [Cyclobacteriaceae bacterium HetDA_MAG_MS6]
MDIEKKVALWLSSAQVDADTKEQIKTLRAAKDDTEYIESFYKDLEFGTGGLRGIMGVGTNRMNKYTVGMATQGLANYLKQSFNGEISVAIAHDSRNNSRFFAETTADVFSSNGIKVFLFQSLRPTPELSFAIRHLGCQGGVVLTASHNPKEYNGYKAYWNDGAQLIPPHDLIVIKEVGKIESLDEVRFDRNSELISPIGEELDEAYLKMIESLSLSPSEISEQKDLKIVFSSIHGTGITLVPPILSRLGFSNVHVVQQQKEPDGNFPTVVYPNPEEAEAMTLALKQAEEIDADLVMATDPDSDRVGIAVKNTMGHFQLLNGNQTGAMLIYYLLSKWQENHKLTSKEYIVKTIVTTDLIERIAESFDVKCYNTLTGFKYIAELIRELEGKEKFIGGGEESYGYLIGDEVRDKDAIASCAMIAEMAAWAKSNGKSIFELLIEVNTKFGLYHEGLKSLTKKGKSGSEEIQAMMIKFRENPPKTLGGSAVSLIKDYKSSEVTNLATSATEKIDLPTSNVLQFFTEDGSKISVRPSGTEPKIKFYFSVNTSLNDSSSYFSKLEGLQNKINQIAKELED